MRSVAVLLSMFSLGGCAYLQDRANDALDVFRFDVGQGPGLYAEARVTDFAALGLGYRRQQMAGLHGRYTGTYEAGSIGVAIYTFGEASQHDYGPVLAAHEFDPDQDVVPQQFLVVPSMGFFRPYRLARRGLHVADFGASVAIVEVGASVGLSPGELLDFVLGFVGIDLAGDDVYTMLADRAEAGPGPSVEAGGQNVACNPLPVTTPKPSRPPG